MHQPVQKRVDAYYNSNLRQIYVIDKFVFLPDDPSHIIGTLVYTM